MPTFDNTPRGTVVSIWGKAYIRGADGVWRPLKLGEVVKPGDAMLTDQDAIVQMVDAGGATVVLPVPAATDRAITAVEQGQPDAAPAAGLAGGDGGELQPGLRIDRLVESITPADVATRLDGPVFVSGLATQSDPALTAGVGSISAPSSVVGATEAGAPVGLGLTAPTGSGTLVVSVTQVPVIGQIVRADGSPVAAGDTLTPADLPGLRYVPPADYDGAAPVGGFTFTVSNGSASASGGTQISLTAVNDAPLATAGSASGLEDGLIGLSLGGTDVDGTIAVVRVGSLPANGTLLLADGVTTVVAGQDLTPAQAAGLVFRPAADFNGTSSLSFIVIDNAGATSSPATFTLNVAAVNDAPVAVADSVSTVGTVPVSVAVRANDSDPDGDTLAVTGASVPPAQGSVSVAADGTVTFTAAPGVTGPVVVTYTVADPAGATATASLTVNVAAAPTVSVDGPALTNDSTPTIGGSTNLAPGSTVTLTVTGADGAVQTFTATVQPDGSYAADVPAALADGPYSVTASVSVGGATASATDGGSIDTAAPAITVDAPALGNDSTPTISGTTSLPAGSVVTLTVTGADGSVQTFTATVQPGGTYSADVPAALAEGSYSVVAVGTDAAGNSGSASDNGVLDLTPPALTVDAPLLGNDTTPTITGTTDLPAGSVITLTVTDAGGAVQTFTAVVQPGGSYSADVPAPLAEGGYAVTATGTDAAGNAATATDSGALDLTPPTLAVDAPALTNDSTPAITGTTNLAPGSTVTLTVTGANGAVQTFTATVQAGGTYSADVPAALAEGGFAVTATATDPAGNSASAADSGVLDLTAPSLSVDAPALTNDSTPTITGTTDLPAGTVVTLTVTGADGAVQTFTATVQPGGSYSADVPAPLVQGNFSIVASATDAAGNAASATDNGALDLTPPAITVDVPAVTNDTTPSISGTTDLPAGSTITLTVTGADGAVQVFTATVQPGGTYAADVPAALVAGAFSISASGTDAAGNSASASDSGTVDLTAPSLAVDAPALTNDSTPTITGTTDLPAGSIITLVVTGSNGAVQTFTATVQAGGTFSADVPAALTEGAYVVDASGTDSAGNSASANDSGAIDLTPPAASVSLNAVTGDDIVNAGEAAGSVAITGTVGGDVSVGDIVTLVVNGNTYTGSVQAGNTFSIAVAGVDVLADADRRIDASVSTTDAAGNTGTGTATRTYAVNTAPVAVADTVSVGEDSASATGDATPGTPGQDSDADGDALTVTGVAVGALPSASGNVGSALAGTWGSLTLQADGSYAYVPGPAAQSLDAGQTVTDTFTYTIDDGRGGSATATLTVSVTGADDPTLITGTLTGAVVEDGVATATGSLTATDADVGTRAFTPQVATAGAYGSFSIDAAGQWTYVLSNAAPQVQALAGGQVVTETFTVAADDGTSVTVTVSVTGTDDAPVISSGSGAVTEDTSPTATGTLTATDADNPALAFVAGTQSGSHGSLVLNAAGTWTYTLGAAAQALAGGQVVTDTFTVTLTDGSTTTVTITATGTDDAPVISSGTGAVTEDTSPTATGTLTATDADNPALAFVAGAQSGAYGSLVLNAAGAWTYTLGTAAQALAGGQVVTDTFTVTLTDGSTTTVTITATGTDDAPVISSGTGTVTEDTSPTATGTLTATDADNPALAFVAVTQSGAYGSLVLNAAGAWTYTLGAAAQALAGGQVVTDTFTVTLTDGSTTTVTITATGTDDAPVISSGTGAVTEDTSPTATGTLTATDADNPALTFVAGTQSGAYGSLVLNATGAWTYSLGAAAQALGGGQVVTDAFTVTLTDGSTTTVTITVTGTDDAPVISSGTGAVTEDTSPTATGTLTATDADNPALAFVAGTQSGAYGSLVLSAAGTWTYTLGAAAQALAGGQVVTDTFTVTLTDGSTTTVTITATGTDDAPVISSGTGTVTEDTSPTATGTLTATDADNSGLAFVAGTQSGAYGSLTLSAAGAWTYTLGAAAQALAGGQVVTDTFTVTLTDGSTSTVTITATGTDDAPVISSGTGTVTEDTSPTATGTLTASDTDNPALTFVAGTQSGAYGSLVLNAAGAWTYTLGAAAQALAGGQVVTDTFTVTLTDGSTTTVTITATGTDDAPVISSGTGAVTEDISPNTAGTLTATDADNPALAFVAGTQSGAYGSLVLNAAGAWTYTLGAAAQALAGGQVVTDAFTVTLTDGSTTTVTITVTGTDGAPVISSGTGAVTEDTSPTATGTLTATDVDNPSLAFVAGTQSGAYGSLVLNASGAWTYTLGAAAQALAGGQVVTDTFTVTLTDGSTTTVTITATGTDDAPVISSGTGTVTEDTSPTATGTLTATDADNPALAFVAGTQSGAYGSLVLNAAGAWTYTLGAAAQALAGGQVVTDTFTVTLTDGSTTTVTITATGTDDAPVISSGTGAVTEDTSPTATGTLTATDADNPGAGLRRRYAIRFLWLARPERGGRLDLHPRRRRTGSGRRPSGHRYVHCHAHGWLDHHRHDHRDRHR
jgi:VCBS repeat-containing protein